MGYGGAFSSNQTTLPARWVRTPHESARLWTSASPLPWVSRRSASCRASERVTGGSGKPSTKSRTSTRRVSLPTVAVTTAP